ncbi:hypothetical protein MCUN1_002683 [Malassezia cuniculi]|uniref:EamA domain-containing protein n=1 Tax=Malassezia cuniculi TaxID=948313 RepID=A0AAF0ESB8_9BASI|nr:hypothetical protein MCUN1_002683 [Malassezia cuniculi]
MVHPWALPGGKRAVCVFVLVLAAYTLQTESIQYVQRVSGYDKPLTLLYVTHSSFILLLPAYLFVLRVSGRDAKGAVDALRRDIAIHMDHLSSKWGLSHAPLSVAGRAKLFTLVIVILTFGLTLPSLSWFLAVPFTSMGNITAIYNTFSIWALVLAIAVLGEPWKLRDAGAVLLACAGVTLVAYGGASQSYAPASRALLGDGLALLGAVSMAVYETIYRIVATVEDKTQGYALIQGERQPEEEASEENIPVTGEESYAPLPFGMYAISMTTGIGVATMTLFWAPLLAAHILGWETLELPPSTGAVGVIALSIVCGVLFNGAFTVLLSLWGPVLASVSCLLTTVLVQAADVALGMPWTWMSVAGCAIVACGFSLLVWF